MPASINSALVVEKNTLHNLDPWLWLFEIQIDDTEALRVAGYDQEVTYGGETYSPFPVSVGSQTRDRQGTLQEAEVTVANIGAVVSGYLEDGNLLGKKCVIRLVHEDDLTDSVFGGEFDIIEATATLESVAFRLALYRLSESPFPAQLFNRGRCRWRYGGAGCNYNRNLPNAISGTNPDFDPASCDLSLDGPNGCTVHGLNEQANGVPIQHPAFFGGFPGIPKGPARV